MKQDVFVTKGTRVLVRRFIPKPLGSYSIAGAQMKLVGDMEQFEATVAHVYGDDPTNPTKYEFAVRKDDNEEVRISQGDILGVIESI